MKTKHEKIVEVLKEKLERRANQEKIHGVGRVSHTLQIPLHIDDAEWLIEQLEPEAKEMETSRDIWKNIAKRRGKRLHKYEPRYATLDEIEQLEPEVSNKCKCKNPQAGWTTVMACNMCGFICDPVWTETKLTPHQPSGGEIDKLWYKFAGEENDFGNLFLGRDAYDLLMDELLNQKR